MTVQVGGGMPLRALLLTMDLPPTRGGIQTMAREILARAAGTSFRVVAPADRGSAVADATAGVPIRRVRPVAPGRRGFVPTIAFAARQEISRQRPDVVLALHALAAPAGIASHVPTVLVCHGGEFRSARIRRVARWALPRAERIVANSGFTRSEAIALGADPLRVTVIPVGAPDPVPVARERVQALRARFGGRFVLSVARLEPHKGHDALIRAIRDLPGDPRLVVVGEGSARGGLEALARAGGVADRVFFAGPVEDDELPAFYAAADAFALLSRATGTGVEGGGIALLEAAAYGLPLVAGRTGGIPETVRDGETGLLVDPDDSPAVVRALRRVLEDRALAERLGAAARAMATGERSWRAFVERIETVLVGAARSPQVVA